MSLYTRRGDDGTTSLGDGTRVSKCDSRVEAYGAVDEANSMVGLARVVVNDEYLESLLCFIQHKLLNCTSSLAVPLEAHRENTPVVTAADVRALEDAADALEVRTGRLTGFVLESGCEAAARLHAARAVVRRAERRVTALAAAQPVAEHVPEFLNRASDVLFSAARWANALAGWPEERWDPTANLPSSPS